MSLYAKKYALSPSIPYESYDMTVSIYAVKSDLDLVYDVIIGL